MHRLELRVSELMQLFNSLDPTPFLHRDLDRSAETYIENWAREFPPDSRRRLRSIWNVRPPQAIQPS